MKIEVSDKLPSELLKKARNLDAIRALVAQEDLPIQVRSELASIAGWLEGVATGMRAGKVPDEIDDTPRPWRNANSDP